MMLMQGVKQALGPLTRRVLSFGPIRRRMWPASQRQAKR